MFRYFAHLLSIKKTERKKTACKKVKGLYSEEALTADDIFERLDEEEDKQKLEKKNRRLQGQRTEKIVIMPKIYTITSSQCKYR